MNKMKIAFYLAKHGNPYDYLISGITLSKYSHCEIVFSDGVCASSSPRDGGVRFKKIDLSNVRWHVFNLRGEFPEGDVRKWFELHDHQGYDWPGAVGSAFGLDLTRKNKKFCSFACAIVLGLDPIVTPAALYKQLRDQGIINAAERII